MAGETRTPPPIMAGGALHRYLRASPDRPAAVEIAIGVGAALIAIAVRMAIPLEPQQLPTMTVVVALAIVTTLVGKNAGIACAVTGGTIAWYRFFNPDSWSLANGAWLSLLGFVIVATVIVTTAHLYRASERRWHERQVAALAAQAETAELFARELAHRLKNALTIVQAIALQTLDAEAAATRAFTSRLRTLATANDLLSEHVSDPVAPLARVIDAVLAPFGMGEARFEVEVADVALPAQQVVTLSLVLHELATNATKYGALSVPAGRVAIATIETDGAVRLTWRERGGPAVKKPERTGFGTRLLRRSGPESEIDYAPDGLRCVLVLDRG